MALSILTSWYQSITFGKPAVLKQMGLLVFKNLLAAYTVMFSQGLLVLIGPFIFCLLAFNISQNVQTSFCFYWIASIFFMEAMYLMLRPSVVQKDLRYFRSRKMFTLLNALLGAGALSFYLTYGTGSLVYLLLLYTCPLFHIFCFAFLDSYGSLRDVGIAAHRAFIMVTYNAPLFVILWLLFGLWAWALWYTISFLPYTFANTFFFALPMVVQCTMVMLCTLSVVYVKKLHEQFQLYYRI